MTETSPAPSAPVKTIAFVLYPGLTPLDIVGPLQVFAALADLVPGYRTVVIGERIEPIGSDTPLSLVPSHTFEEIADPHATIVPGGLVPTLAAMADENLLGNLRETAARSQIVGSVCTGSLLLAAAGLLEGRQATTHWMYRDLLARFGATPVTRRWVEDGHFITAASTSRPTSTWHCTLSPASPATRSRAWSSCSSSTTPSRPSARSTGQLPTAASTHPSPNSCSRTLSPTTLPCWRT